ncbi:S-layer homology domain-containing protein [Alteribacillus bidgolensis]|uniref:S-layer homology domain-containing protein n=1 Tax=Alteribacillus bidgolensis TaxID=930129 RepID=A0A1G8PLX1_9BACI|nr:S-layer homology domain-containing protein [Alteribacillus bidgolensis]SDI93494.1 S-layer homology domain-containing protein [Alteribacillus bidgolensis]
MSYQPKSYRKFLAGSVSAAMVATTFGAVNPVNVQTADAAEAFPDVDNDYWASGSIQRLADQGVISGYKDGTYRPGEEINRGQVAAMLVAAFDLDVDENAEPPFEDLNPESYFTPYAAAVKEADLIKGRENNTQFAAGMDLSREQMATILVRAFDLEARDDVDADVGDIDKAHESHRSNIEILAQYDITNTADGNFRPKETVTRAQFAAFLDRAMQVDKEVDTSVSSVTAVDNTTVEVGFDGDVEAAVAEDFTFDPELAVLDAEVISPSDSEENQDAEGSVVRLTTEEQTEDEEYTLSYQGETTGQTFTGVAAEPAVVVEDISAVSTTSFEIDVDGELDEDLDEAAVEELLDVAVVNGDDEETALDVTGVEISEDRETITVEHADDDLEGTAGTLVVNEFEYDFDYESIEVDSVEATTTSIRSEADQQLEFTVNGFRNLSIDTLEEAGYEVEFLYSSEDDVFDEDAREQGIIDASELEESFSYAVEITDEDGNTVTSEDVTVDVNDAGEVTEVTEVGLFDGEDRWENDYVTSANQGNEIQAVAGLNFFGEEISEEIGVTVESVTSSDASIAYYDNEDGLQINGEGEVTLTVQFEGIEEPVELDLEVVADQELTSIEEDGTTEKFAIDSEGNVSGELEATLLDQYGENWEGNDDISVTVTGENDFEEKATISADAGNVSVDFDDLEGDDDSDIIDEPGEYSVSFEDDNGNALGTVDVEFVELQLDEVDNFTLSADPESVDLYEDEDTDFEVTIGAIFDEIDLEDGDVEEALAALEGDIQLSTSDEEVVSIDGGSETEVDAETLDFTVSGESEGTATITLEQEEGDFTTALASVEVEVENSTPQITDLTLADEEQPVEVTEDTNGEWSVVDPTQLASSNVEEINNEDMIASVDFSANDEAAIITITDEYGGETFVVDAEDITSSQ